MLRELNDNRALLNATFMGLRGEFLGVLGGRFFTLSRPFFCMKKKVQYYQCSKCCYISVIGDQTWFECGNRHCRRKLSIEYCKVSKRVYEGVWGLSTGTRKRKS